MKMAEPMRDQDVSSVLVLQLIIYSNIQLQEENIYENSPCDPPPHPTENTGNLKGS